MGGVQFDSVEARVVRAFGGIREGLDDGFDVVNGGLLGRLIARECDSRRRDRRPPTVRQWHRTDPVAGEIPPRRRLAPGMAQLDAHRRAHAVPEGDDAGPDVTLRVVPQAAASGRDPPVRRDGRSLGDDQAKTANRPCAIMHHVPIIRHPVNGLILAHRWQPNPVAYRQITKFYRVEQRSHGIKFRQAFHHPVGGGFQPA